MQATAKERTVEELLRGPLLRKHQRVEWAREIADTDRSLDLEARSSHKSFQNPGRIRFQNEQRKKLLAQQSPRPLTPEEHDKLQKEERVLLADIREGMVSKSEQRRSPANEPGLRQRIRRWHDAKKAKIVRWKNARILLEPDSDDADLCNLERYRPEGALEAATLNAAVPGYMGFSDIADQYETTFGTGSWRDRETQEEFAQRMAALGVTVTFGKASEIRARASVVDVQEGEHATVMTVLPPGGHLSKRKRGRPTKTAA